MKWAALAVLCLAACGSGNGNGMDYAAAYVANWTASGTIEVQGNSRGGQVLVPIQETGTNVIELQGFCSDTDAYAGGPVADGTATRFARTPAVFQARAAPRANLGLPGLAAAGR